MSGTSKIWTQVLRNNRLGSPGFRPKQPSFFNQQENSLTAAIENLGGVQQASPSTYASLLRQCIARRSLEDGKQLHAHIDRAWSGRIPCFLGNLILQLYTRSGLLEDARRVFDRLQQRNIISWTSMMGGYVQQGSFQQALDLFHLLEEDPDSEPDAFVYTIALAACSGSGDLTEGRKIHARCSSRGVSQWDIVLETSFLNMYAKCGSVEDAEKIFISMKVKDSVAWNAMINAYAQNGLGKLAMKLYLQMTSEGIDPSDATFVSVLSISSNLSLTRSIHERFLASGIHSGDVITSLVTAYSRCGDLESSRLVFESSERKSLFLWTAIVVAYTHHGRNREALELFREMCSRGVQPDCYTYSIALTICANIGDLEAGASVHRRIVSSGIQQDNSVLCALINMYSKCGSLELARDVFDRASGRSILIWNSMLSGYVQHERAQEALELYRRMDDCSGAESTSFTYSILLGACTSLEALEDGRRIHEEIVLIGLDSDTVVLNSLVKMYARCGSLDESMLVFGKAVHHSDVITWNAIVVAFARFGQGREALELYHGMLLQGVGANQVTLTGVLTACGHTGLLTRFQSYFSLLVADCGVEPSLEHYECMVDLLSRSGKLGDAEEVLRRMPLYPAAAPWRSLLAACRVHNDSEIANRAAEELVRLEPEDHSAYVILSNVFADEGHAHH